MSSNTRLSQKGFATIIAILMVGMLTLIGIAALSTSDDEVTIAGNELHELQAFYAAEAGLERASAQIETAYETTGLLPSVMPAGTESFNHCLVTYSVADDGPPKIERLRVGTLAGLYGLVKSYAVTSLASSPAERSSVEMTQSFEAILVPLFQFAVFYDRELEIAPGPAMTIKGRIHANGNLHLQAGNQLVMDGKVTSGGDILHGLPNGLNSGSTGNVFLKHQTGLLQNMYDGSGWLDASNPDWYEKAQVRWGGNVQDKSFGHPELNLPLSSSDDPRSLIERADGNPDSYERKATFKIIDGVPLSKIGGVWQNVSGFLPAGTITNTNFFDSRENTLINSTNIDMDKLRSSGYFPVNGVIYSSDHRAGFNGTRMVNGEDIGRPLSLFSDNPVYVQGDFNTVKKQPVAVAADAVIFLSNNWKDVNSTLSLNARNSSATSVNLSFISGNIESTSTRYSGGLENLPRFLEDWSGTDFTFRGSMNCLWESRQATSNWSYGSYYTAPRRDWGFDTDLEDPTKMPPESPSVRVFLRVRWKQQQVGFVEIDESALDTANWVY